MKRAAIVVTALSALFLSGLAAKCVGRAEARPTVRADFNPLTDPTCRRLMQGEPRHWRECALAR